MTNLIDEKESDNIARSYELDYGTTALWYVVERLEGIIAAENAHEMYQQLVQFYGECRYNAGVNTAHEIRNRQEQRNKLI